MKYPIVMAVNSRTYLDYNASAPLLACARDSMIAALNSAGNASSVHFEGRAAKKSIEETRVSLANLIDCKPANLVFTSGATEAANHVLSPIVRAGGQQLYVSRLYVGATEHPCMLSGGRFAKEHVVQIPTSSDGILDTEALTKLLTSHDSSLGLPMVAVQYANNETGIIQPLSKIAELVHAHDGLFVVDAVQALGKEQFTQEETGADFLILSSHKIGGPQGVGAIVLRDGAMSPAPLLTGGGQENYHRGGTENVAAIAGFGAACQWHQENLTRKIKISTVRDSIEAGISTISHEMGNVIVAPVFFGAEQRRLANTSCFAVPGIKAETALMGLDLEGISLSSGSACSSGKVKRSHVLDAMGASKQEMEGALRISLGWQTDKQAADHFLNAWKTIMGRMAA